MNWMEIVVLLVFGLLVAAIIYTGWRKLQGSTGGSEEVIFVDDNGEKFTEGKLSKCGEDLYLKRLDNKKYVKITKTIEWNGKRLPLIDVNKGVSLIPEIDDDVLRLKSNPQFIGRILDPVIIQNAFKIKPDLKQLIAAFIIGIIVGVIFFAPAI